VNGTEYLAVVVGEAGNQQTPNLPATEGSRIVAYSIGRADIIVNSRTGQVALAKGSLGPGGESEGPPQRSSGSAPYTKQQVAQGRRDLRQGLRRLSWHQFAGRFGTGSDRP